MTTQSNYIRDLSGHGPTTPRFTWPDGGKVAVSLVLNFEEGGENNVLHGDAASEAFLSEIVGAGPWPGQRHWNMERIYEYGARAGFWRLHRLMADLPVTVYGVATALARAPEQVAAMKDAGWEIASHGYKWIEYKDFAPADELAHINKALELHSQVVGQPPVGWYTGRCSVNTVQLAAQAAPLKYISDCYADDLPYWLEVSDGERQRDQLILPYTLDANDMRFATPQGFNSGDQFYSYLKDSLDCLLAEGEAGTPKMMSVGLHCRLIGRPGRVQALARFIDYARSLDGVWFATREQIADFWADRFPPARPAIDVLALDHDGFVKHFGGVFEHSAWVAEQAFALEKGPAHNSAVGVHSLLCRAFRAANADDKLAVLRAHPDLAGKLAQAKRLTAASTAEQASAGLDALTDAERATFQELNQQYTAQFGFPFIIAVKENTKASILEAFHPRLNNTADQEFATACEQVERIALHRLKAMFDA